jgi:hypothetical protein
MVRCPRDFSAKPGLKITIHYDVTQLQAFDKRTTAALPRAKC